MEQRPRRLGPRAHIDARIGPAAGFALIAVIAVALFQSRLLTSGAPAPSDEPSLATSAEPTDVLVKSPDPDGTPPPELSPEPTTQATPFASDVPTELADVLSSSRWVLPADNGWVAGDYAGREVPVNLSALATIDVHQSLITAVDPVAGSWIFYAVNPLDGTTTEILRLPESQSTILATRSLDGSRLFFHSGAPGVDGGIEMVDLATGTRTTLAKSQDASDQERRLLFWSVSGKTLLSLLCGAHECWVDVIDQASGTIRRLPKQFGAIAASDRFALGYSSAEGPTRPWELYDLSSDTTRVIAKQWIAETEEGIAVGGDSFVVAGWSPDASVYSIVMVDGVSGEERLVSSQSGKEAVLRLQPYLASDRWVAVSSTPLWRSVLNGGGALSILELSSGDLLPDVGRVAAP
jgi:hypothetical protein